MSHSVRDTFHVTRESAEKAQRTAGTSGYSEVYPLGVSPCRVLDPETNKEVDGWQSRTETYSG